MRLQKRHKDRFLKDHTPSIPAKNMKTKEDSIIRSVRRTRNAHARKFNYDLDLICEDFKRIELDYRSTIGKKPKPATFAEQLKKARDGARKAGLKRSDITAAIKKVRRRNKVKHS